MAGPKLEAKLGLDNSEFKRKLKDSEKSAKDFSAGLKTVGVLAAAGFTAALVFAKKAAVAYDEEAKAQQSLLIALKGQKDIQERLIQQASQLQRTTLFGDEQTVMAMSRLAMVIGVNETAIKRLTPLVQDLAQAKFEGNLVTAADLVAKSVGSSTNALSRYGIEVKGAVGSTERLESAISGLNKQVGGQAEAAAKVGLGALTQLKNAWSDLTEVIGASIVESEGFKKSVNGLTKLVQNIQDRGLLSTLFEKRSTWEAWKKEKERLDVTREGIPLSVMNGPAAEVVGIRKVVKSYEELADAAEEATKQLEELKKVNTALFTKGFRGESFAEVGQKGIMGGGLARGGSDLAGGPEATNPVNEMTDALQLQSEAVNILTNSFDTLFSSTTNGFQNMVATMIDGMKRLVAEYLAKALIFGLIRALFPGSDLAIGATEQLWNMGLGGKAKGGLGGFQSQPLDVNVTGILKGKDIALVLRRNG